MLKKLIIEQFVIIDRLELDVRGDLTVLTGETGAGKSILLDAMGLILGDPAKTDSIRQGSDKSYISALFAPPPGHPAWAYLGERNLAVAGSPEFVIERTIHTDGQDDIKVSGKTSDMATLKELGALLVEIHGQFANQSLLDPANQLTLLDLSGGFPPEIFKNVSNALAEVRRLSQELEDENSFQAKNKQELPKLETLNTRLEKLGMKPGFVDHVRTEHAKLLTAKETSEAFQTILSQLIAANGVVMGLSSAINILARNKNLDPEQTAELADYLDASLENAREAVKEMRRIGPQYDIDFEPLERYQAALSALQTIAKENKITLDTMQDWYGDFSAKLNRLRNGQKLLAGLEDALAKAKGAYRHHAHILTEKRIAAAAALSESITAEFAPLKLPRAEFQVSVIENTSLPWTDLGINQVTFNARMNPGMPFSPVAETASGGELARLILALKVVVQRVQTIPTLIFDEVDTGIGGSAAAAVGERLARLADTTQVLVITHSPQVAARGAQHLRVSKETDGVKTLSVVKTLSADERTDELSRMLAGDVITSESRAAAISLVDEAIVAAKARRTQAVVA